MYLLMTDETNLEPGERSRFFMYGGLIVPLEQLPALHADISNVRVEYGYAPGDKLKFSSNDRPEGVSPEARSEAKDAVIDACKEHGVQFVVDLVLHDIARNKAREDLVGYGVNSVLMAFHRFLRENNSAGIVAVDRLPIKKPYQFLRDKFVDGLVIEQSGNQWQLDDRVMLFASTCDGASHLSSAVDVVLGGFRYCVNQRAKKDVPRRIMEKVATMMWHRQVGEVLYLREYGLLLRPKHVRLQHYQAEYDDLVQHLGSLIKDEN